MRISATILALMLATPAAADWQYTHWGQTLDELLETRRGAVRVTSQAERSAAHPADPLGPALAVARYDAAGLQMHASFYFPKGGLAGVRLRPLSGGDAATVLSMLNSQYGSPEKDKQTANRGCWTLDRAWRDKQRGNIIAYLRMQCGSQFIAGEVLYTPMRSANETGL